MKKIFTAVSVFTVNFLLLLITANSYGQKPDSTFNQDGILVSNSDTTGGVKNYWDAIVVKDRRLLALFEEGWTRPDGTGAGGHFIEILDENGQRDTEIITGSGHFIAHAQPQKLAELIERYASLIGL